MRRHIVILSISLFLTFLVVSGVALESGVFFNKPPVAHAALINIPPEYRPTAKLVTNCLIQAALGIPIIYIGSAPFAVLRGGVYVIRAARLALAVERVVQAELEYQQFVTVTAIVDDLRKVSPELVGTITAGNCLGIVAFKVNDSITNFIWGSSDPDGTAQALASDPTTLCSTVTGSTFDANALACQNADGSYSAPDGTILGPSICSRNPGTAFDETSGFCSDFGGASGTGPTTYYSTYGDTLGQCQTGFPLGDNATCTDGNGHYFAPNGTPLNAPTGQLPPCADFLAGNGSSSNSPDGSNNGCDYLVLTLPTPVPPTDTPVPPPPTSTPPPPSLPQDGIVGIWTAYPSFGTVSITITGSGNGLSYGATLNNDVSGCTQWTSGTNYFTGQYQQTFPDGTLLYAAYALVCNPPASPTTYAGMILNGNTLTVNYSGTGVYSGTLVFYKQ